MAIYRILFVKNIADTGHAAKLMYTNQVNPVWV
jgi:hypothetical protein